MEINFKEEESYVYLAIDGSLSLDNIITCEKELKKYHSFNKHIIFDFANMKYIDSSCLGILYVYASKSEKIGKKVAFVNFNDQIKEVLELTGLSDKLESYDTKEEAIKSFKL